MGGEASEGEAKRESRVKNGDKRDKQTGLETGGGGGGREWEKKAGGSAIWVVTTVLTPRFK